jgi:hypothetical protein
MASNELAIKIGFTHKRCQKCGGNVYLEKDDVDWYEQCLQCGSVSYLRNLVQIEKGQGKSRSINVEIVTV